MKLQPDTMDVQSIVAYGPGWVTVAQQQEAVRYTQSVVIGSHGERFDWHCSGPASLTAGHFEQLVACRPELVILGSGNRLKFPAPALLRTMMSARIGLETMDTLAACRTYNILAGEGRHVIAALILEG